jgi:hypothetical protein
MSGKIFPFRDWPVCNASHITDLRGVVRTLDASNDPAFGWTAVRLGEAIEMRTDHGAIVEGQFVGDDWRRWKRSRSVIRSNTSPPFVKQHCRKG